jgi:hypothetical protein
VNVVSFFNEHPVRSRAPAKNRNANFKVRR